MEKNNDFFGAISMNINDFKELPLKEQYKHFIKNKIYLKGISEEVFNSELKSIRISSDSIDFLGKDFVFENNNYTLNSDFISSLFDEINSEYKSNAEKSIQNQLEVLRLKTETIDNDEELIEFISQTKKDVKFNYEKNLYLISFQKVHHCKTKNQLHVALYSLLKYDAKALSDFIFGLGNYQSSTIYSHKSNYERYHTLMAYCNKIEKKIINKNNFDSKETDNKTKVLDAPIKVLIIEKLIKNAHKWEATDERKKAYIISKIIDRNEDNIRKTLVKSDKKTSEYSKKFINDINIANDIIHKLG